MKIKMRLFFILAIFICAAFLLTGCESLRKKFTRTKKKSSSEEEMIVSPRDYSENPLPVEVLYKQYFAFWKSWNQELVSALNDTDPHKKILVCVRESIKNLKNMSSYLVAEKKQGLQVYIERLSDLEKEIGQLATQPPSRMRMLKYKAERILSAVNRNYDFRKMSSFLIRPQPDDAGVQE